MAYQPAVNGYAGASHTQKRHGSPQQGGNTLSRCSNLCSAAPVTKMLFLLVTVLSGAEHVPVGCIAGMAW